MTAGILLLATPEADLYAETDVEGGVYLHLDFKAPAWTKQVYKSMQQSFVKALVKLALQGTKEVFVILRKDDVQTIRFETKFGFKEEKTSEEFVRMKLEI